MEKIEFEVLSSRDEYYGVDEKFVGLQIRSKVNSTQLYFVSFSVHSKF